MAFRRGHRAAEAKRLCVTGCMLSDPGSARALNEDRAAYVIPHPPDPRAGVGLLALVADGMGGHAAGEVASELAADTIVRTYYASADGERHAALCKAFKAANYRIHQAALEDPSRRGMGTTCTALAIDGRAAYAAHVGDSRLYLARGGALRQLTEDHSLVAELVRAGHISRELARGHADRNVILRALGTRPAVEVAVWRKPLALAPGDRFLLCSDGLSDLVPDEEIDARLRALAPAEACQALVDLAIAAGGSDNVTVGVFAVAEAPARTGAAEAVRATRTDASAGGSP